MTAPGEAQSGPDPVEVLSDGVVVIGTGLIGTSLGLALARAGIDVHLRDAVPAKAQLAAELGAGTVGWPEVPPALVVAAVPVGHTATVLSEASRRYLKASLTDTASVKTQVQVDIEGFEDLADRFVGGHPMAGRERSGAAVADPNLFRGRSWVLTPSARSTSLALSRAQALVRACEADLVSSDPLRHDQAVALVSHAPQVVASLMAARLVAADHDLVSLAGPGIRDVTRVAGSDPALWVEILTANAGRVLPVLDDFAGDLDELRMALEVIAVGRGDDQAALRESVATVEAMLTAGCVGRDRLPGKHGGRAARYSVLQVVVGDRPGQLARIFTAADEAGVNIEDVSIEHAPGHPVGVVELMVAPHAAPDLERSLRARGWSVHV